jgi:putative transcriptional regulator
MTFSEYNNTRRSNQDVTFSKEVITLIKNRIKVLRSERDWTQVDLAERVGVSRQAVISIEKYKYTPSLELAFQIAKAFEVDVNEVFKLEEDE